jgi:hypothetical protein
MRRPRITIASLLGVVAFIGVAFAALREPTDAWDSALLGLSLVILLASVLLAVHRTDERRTFWLGFTLFGWAYLVASVVPPIASRLPTYHALVAMFEMLPRPEIHWEDDLIMTGIRSFDVTALAPSTPTTPNRWDVTVFNQPTNSPLANHIKRLVVLPGETVGNFVRIGHSLIALMLAFLGAHFSRYLYETGRPERAAGPDILSPDASR